MIMSAVVNPKVFLEDNFDANNKYRDNISVFLQGIKENGILIDDSDGTIKKQLINYFLTLPMPKIGIKSKKIFEELCNQNSPRKFFVLSNTYKTSGEEIDDLIHRVASENKADEEFDENKLLEYIQSEFEDKRRELSQYSKSLHQTEPTDIDEMLIRCVKFSKKLRFYDSQLGKISSNEDYEEKCSRFCEGFCYIIKLWHDNICVSINNKDKLEVSINTPLFNREHKMRVKQIINNVIVGPIKKSCGVSVDVYLKEDKEKIFHDRFLESDYALILFGRGFDLFKDKKNFRSNTIKLMKFSSEHMSTVKEYFNLPTIK